jgi:succinate dehydrogenase / fumarate reductase cytochrome b subunit
MLQIAGRANRLGIRGWAGGGHWGLERYLYTLHRVSGLALLTYFLLHVVVTSSRGLGREAWEAAMRAVASPVFGFGEYLVFLAFVFHALNGVRLVVLELFGGVGRAEEPVYPYRTSVDFQRPLALVVLALTGLLAALGAYDFMVGH